MDLQTSEDISAQVCTTFQVVIHIAPSVHLQFGAPYGVRAKRGSLRVDICHVTRQEGSKTVGSSPYHTLRSWLMEETQPKSCTAKEK